MKRVVSIQSHVASGYVGNRAAAFVLQRLGVEVDVVNTVQFSNHTGYGEWTGQIFESAHLVDIIDGLEKRGVFESAHAVLSGYLGSQATGDVVLDAVGRMRRSSDEKRLYCCDPVMGDVGRGVFVAPEIPAFFREVAVPAAQIVTPNLFELGLLTETDLSQLERTEDVCRAAESLQAMGPELVLVTSVEASDSAEGEISMLLLAGDRRFRVSTPRLSFPVAPNGSGDATAALFLGHYLQCGDAETALQLMCSGVYAMFDATWRAKTRELQIIQAQAEIVAPTQLFRVERL